MHRTYFIKTFGCQMNEHDSEKIALILESMGYMREDDVQQADLVVINTCTIREKPHHKAISEIGKVLKCKQANQSKLLCVCGCVAQQEGELLVKRFPDIDVVFGPDQIFRLPQLIVEARNGRGPIVATSLINQAADYKFINVSSASANPVAYVTIMKGCDNFCSYCIVPYVRGRQVSRRMEEIIDEVARLVDSGTKEVTLLGQNVNAYGADFASKRERNSLAHLIRNIAHRTRIERIRFTSPHPGDFTDDLVEEYTSNPKLCHHVHLPVQSGSDKILKAMRRRYTRRQFVELVEKLKTAVPDIAITTDIIVGFPGETNADYAQTIDLIKTVRFDNIYAFAYSPRPNTPIFKFKDDVPKQEKLERLNKLLEIQRVISMEINKMFVGRVCEVLVEGCDRRKSGLLMGRNSQNKVVNFAGQKEMIGNIVRTVVKGANINSLKGEVIY